MESPYEKHHILNMLMSNDGRKKVQSAFESAGMVLLQKDTIPDMKTDISYLLLNNMETSKNVFAIRAKNIQIEADINNQNTQIKVIEDNVNEFISNTDQRITQLSDSIKELSESIKTLQVSVDQRITEDTILNDKFITLEKEIKKSNEEILNLRIDVDALLNP